MWGGSPGGLAPAGFPAALIVSYSSQGRNLKMSWYSSTFIIKGDGVMGMLTDDPHRQGRPQGKVDFLNGIERKLDNPPNHRDVLITVGGTPVPREKWELQIRIKPDGKWIAVQIFAIDEWRKEIYGR
jgi:hypothetical protein